MAFTITDPTYDLIPEGYYDAMIIRAISTRTRNGTEYIAVDLLLDNGRQTTLPIWKIKNNPTQADIELGGWSARTVMALSKAVGMTAGMSFASMEEWSRALRGKHLQIYLEHETYQGQTRERVTSTSLSTGKDMTAAIERYKARQTRQPAPAPAPAPVPASFAEVDDDDLPF